MTYGSGSVDGEACTDKACLGDICVKKMLIILIDK
jgi:hypothetical protein